jgi:regulator of sigma E protease
LGKRALVISSGVIMNFILAVILFYIFFLFTGFYTDVRKIGDPVFTGAEISNPPYIYFLSGTDNSLYADSVVIRANGGIVSSEEQFNELINNSYNKPISLELQKLTDSGYYFTKAEVILNGDGIKSNFDSDIIDSPYISKVNEGSLAELVGLVAGDQIIEINDITINTQTNISEILEYNINSMVNIKYFDNKGEVVNTEVYLYPNNDGEVLLGITYYYLDQYPDFILRLDYDSNKILSGIAHTLNMSVYNFSGLWELIKQSLAERSIEPVSSGVSSIVGVSDFVYNLVKIDDFVNIINLTALVSLSLGIMNILPIPLFDGGHLLFIVIEKIRGKKINEKAQEKISTIAFYGLVILSILIIFKDIWQFNFFERIANLLRSIFGS